MGDMERHAPERIKRVVLLIGLFSSYSQGILRGINSWIKVAGNWYCAGVHTPPAIALAATAILARQRPDGIIAAITDEAVAKALRRLRVPVVDICDWFPAYRFPRVLPDDVAVGRLAAAHLLECRLRSFGFAGDFRASWCRRRFEGFAAALGEAGFPCHRFDGAAHPTSEWMAASWFASSPELITWLAKLPKPIGLMGANDQWAIHLSASTNGIHVPEDAAIIGVDNDTLLCELARPPLSSVATDTQRIGYEAAALLDRMMKGQSAPAETTLIPNRGVVTRQSTSMLAVNDKNVADAVRFIRESGGKGISVAHVLARIPESRRTLERRFRKLLNRGIWEEIRRVRLEGAMILLRDSDLPLKALAPRVGFSSADRLGRAFLQFSGQPPRAYRMQFRTAKIG